MTCTVAISVLATILVNGSQYQLEALPHEIVDQPKACKAAASQQHVAFTHQGLSFWRYVFDCVPCAKYRAKPKAYRSAAGRYGQSIYDQMRKTASPKEWAATVPITVSSPLNIQIMNQLTQPLRLDDLE